MSGRASNRGKMRFGLPLGAHAALALLLLQAGVRAVLGQVPTLTVNDVTVIEGNSGLANAIFSVTLSATSTDSVSVEFSTADGTASAGSDYVAQSGLLTFPPGTATQTVSVTINGDLLNEADETFFLNLTSPTNATLANSQGAGTILNDDPVPSVAINDVTVVEANSGSANAVFTITLSAASGQTVALDFSTADGTATAGSDYVPASGLVTFPAGSTNQTIALVINGDTFNESNETFFVNLVNPTNATLADAQGVCTINNDDPQPNLRINDVTATEGNSGTTNTVFTVSLSTASGFTVSVNYATANGTATAGSDYVGASGTLTFPPGTTNQTISITVNGDTLNESNETFFVNLANPTNATLADAQGVCTNNNDDPQPSLRIDDVTVTEGNSGTVSAVFTVSLSAASGLTVSAAYATANGTATAGTDYLAASGTVTFPQGSTNQAIALTVNGDLMNESNESIFVNLSNPTNATIADNQGVGTINNDDPQPSISINDVAVTEGNSGTNNAVFSVTLSAPSGFTVTVNHATADGSANAGSDYVAASGTLTFASGTTNQTITVGVRGDTVIEANETFFANLTNPDNAALARSQGTGTIADDETRTIPFTNAATITIPGSGAATPYPSTIDLSGLPGIISKVTVTLVNVTHTFSDDIDALLVAPAGQQVLLMSDVGGGNALNNVTLTFDSTASGVLPDSSQISAGTYKPSNSGTNDPFPAPAPAVTYSTNLGTYAGTNPNGTWSLYVNDDTAGDSGTIGGWRLTLTTTNLICCSVGADADLSVTVNDSPDPATAGSNLTYSVVVINNGPANATDVTLTNLLPAGVSFVSAVPSQGSCSRTNSTVTCNLGNLAVGALATVSIMITPTQAGSITNQAGVAANQTDLAAPNHTAATVSTVNLGPPTLAINDVTVIEANVTIVNAVFTVTLSRSFDQTVAVNYATSNGTATAGADYIATSGTLTYPPGTTNRTITVTVNGDRLIESNETFFMNLSGAYNAAIADGQGVCTIQNDDSVLGQLDHFNWGTLATTQFLNVPFNVTVSAVDPNGNTITNFTNTVALSGLAGSGPSLSVLITEVDTDVDKAEFQNVTGFDLDISGWSITLYDWLSWPDPELTFVIPSNTICHGGEIFVLRDNGTFPGAYPNYYTGTNIVWINDTAANQVAVLLRNAANQIVDFMCAVDGFRQDITLPLSIPVTEWQSNPVSANANRALTYQRTGNSDHNGSADWVVAANSVGATNSGLTIPFAGPQPVDISPPTSGNFVAGRWTGSITVLQSATNMYLGADDLAGHKGFSSTFSVYPATDLAVTNRGGPAIVSAGHDVTYTIIVTNQNLLNATGVMLTDTLDPTVSFVSATTSQGTFTPSGGSVAFGLGNLNSGASATCTVVVATTTPGTITNIASVSAVQLDHDLSNNSSTATNIVNQAPFISAIANQVTNEDMPPAAIAFTVGDVESPADSLLVFGTSSNQGLVPDAYIVFGGSGSNRTVTLAPSPNQFGAATITVFVSDSMVTNSSSFLITVNAVNDPPSFVKGPDQTVLEDSGPRTLTGWATAMSAGPPNESSQTLAFLVSNSNPSLFSAQPAVSPAGTLTFTPAANANGSATLTVRLQDSGGTANGGVDLSPAQSFTITVTAVNDPPSFTKGPNQTVPEDSGPQTVVNWATAVSVGPSNESSQTVTFLVSNDNNALFSAPPAISFSGALTYTPATNASGMATVTVQLRDDGGTANGGSDTSAAQSFTITVTAVNDAPVLAAISNQTINEGTTLTFTNTATDIDLPPDTLTFSLDPGAPAGASINPTTGVFTWTPTEGQGPSTNVIAVRVIDSGSPALSDVKSFTVVVNEVNSAPTLTAIADQTINEGSLLTLNLSATDPDIPANTLTFTLVAAPAGANLNPSTGVFTWTPSEAQGGTTNAITVRVTDNGLPALSDTKSFKLVVNELNSPSSVDAIADVTMSENDTLAFTATATDPDVPVQTIAFSLAPGAPAGASIHPVTGEFTWTPIEAQGPSTNVITIRATDDGTPNLTGSRSFTVIVAEVNVPPTLVAIPDQMLNEGATLTVTNTATDPDLPANALTFTLDTGPFGASINPTNGMLSWTPTEGQGPSTNIITVRVTDNGVPELSDVKSFTVVVNEVNSAPTLAAIADQTINEGSLLTLNLSATDPDIPANTLTFTLVAAPAGANLNPSTGVFTWTPSEAQGGTTNAITVRVTDNGSPSLSDTKSFTRVVHEVNAPPALAAIPDVTINESTTLTFTNTATDADLPANTLTFSLDSGAPAGASIDPVSGVFTWTPTEVQGPNTNIITVRVTDNGLPPLSDTKRFTVVVNEVNTAPVLAALADRTINEGETLVLTNSASDADLPANTLTFALLEAPASASLNPATGVLTWTPAQTDGGATNLFTVRVTDSPAGAGPSLSDTKSFTVIVNDVNSPPVLAAIPNQTIPEGGTLTFTNTATDSDVPANTLAFSLEPGAPTGVSINPATGVLIWTPAEAQGPGTNVIAVRVTDNGSPALSDLKSFAVIVTEVNTAPVLAAISDYPLAEGATLAFTNTASDADLPANTLTFSLVSAPAGASIVPATGVFTWTPTEAQGPSTNIITVRVTDSGPPALSDTKSFTVIVTELNSAPVLAAVADRTINEAFTLSITNTATDVDIPTNTLSFSLVAAPAGASLDPSTGVFTWTPSEAQGPSTNVITVRVTDNGSPSLSDTKSFTVVVNEVNTAPVLAATADRTIDEGSTLTLTATAIDADLPANALTFALVSAPSGATINPANGVFTWTPSEAQGPSTNVITVRVSDEGSPPLSDSKTFTVIVREVNSAPVLAAIVDRTISEGQTLSITNVATDADLPANALTFSLLAAPAGASLDAVTGVFNWTPSEAQGLSTNVISVRVTDSGSPALSDTKSFTVVVTEANSAPVLAAVADRTIEEGTTLTLTNTATDSDLPANTLTFSFATAPAGASIDPVTGVFTWTPSEAQGPSTNLVMTRVTDGGTPSLSATQSFTVVVNEVNGAPVLTSIADRTINEGSTLIVTNTANDEDLPANTLTFALVTAPSGAVINPVTGVFTWTPIEAQGPGTNLITVRVTDNGTPSLSATQSFTVIINEVNSAPVLADIAEKTIKESNTLSFQIVATDSDVPANALTFSLEPGAPAGASINAATGVFTWTPTDSQGPSTNVLTVRVTDDPAGAGPPLSDTKNFTVIVNEVNSAPVLAAIPNQTVNEGTTLVFTNTATDPDVPANTLTFSLDSGAPAGASIDPTSGVFTWAPTEAQGPSTNLITVRVTDNGTPSLSDSKSFSVVVQEVNTAPVLAGIPDQTIDEGVTLTLTNVATDGDIPANSLTFSRVTAPAGASIDSTTGVLTWTPTEVQGPSTNLITVRVTDIPAGAGPSWSATQSFTVVVLEVNTAPELAMIPGQFINEGATLVLTNVATDADVPTNTLTYALVTGPTGVSVDPLTGVLTWTPTEAQGPSTNIVTVRVTDDPAGAGPSLSATQSFTVVVNEVNAAPVLAAIADKAISEATTLSFTLTAVDPDNPANALTFSLDTGAPTGAAIHPSTGAFTWIPSETQGPSTNVITVRVTDNGSPTLSDTKSFTVVVSEVNSAPALATVADRTIAEGTTLVISNSATDADVPAHVLSFSLVSAPTGASIDSSTGVFTWTPTEAQGPSTNVVTVRVTDNGSPNLSDTRSLTVVVTEMNSAPVLTVIADRTVSESTPLVITNTATDADVPANVLSFSLIAAPAGASIDPGTGVFTWTPTEAQGPSTNVITVRVSDSGIPSLSDTKSFAIVVTEVNSAPVLTAIADRTLSEGTPLVITNTATDTDVPPNVFSFSLVTAPAGAAIDTSTGVFTWTPTEAQGPSTNIVTVRVTDNGTPSLSDTKSFTIVAQEVNSPPVLASLPERTVNEGGALVVTNSASDADVPANTLTFSLVTAPAGASIDAASGVLTWTPTEAQGPSTNIVTVRVTDNGTPSLSDSKSFTVVVAEVNTAPALAAVADQAINEGVALVVTNTATDTDVPANTLGFSLVAAPVGASIDATTGVFTWTPTEAQGPSTNLITVRVTDNGTPSLSDTKSFRAIVNEVNRPPALAAIADQAVNEGATLIVTNTASDADLPANTLTFSLEPGAPAGASIDAASGVFTWTPTEAQGPSTNTITVRVTDTSAGGGPGLSDTKSFTVIVDEVNTGPALAAVADQTVNEGTTLMLVLAASDPDLPANALTFSLEAGPLGASLDAASGLFTWRPSEGQGPSTNLITVRVTDNPAGAGPALSDVKSFRVIVQEVNSPPVLATIANRTITEGTTLSFTVTATDPDIPANALTYSLDAGAPAGASIQPSTGVFTWTPTEAQGPSTNLITVRVTDNPAGAGASLSDAKSFTVVVTEANSAPVLAAIADQMVNEGETLVLTNTASDADAPANALTFALVVAPTGASIQPSTGVFTWTPTEAQGPSTSLITVRVTDNPAGAGPSLSDTKSFTVVVNEVNRAPGLAPIDDQTVNEHITLSLSLTTTDPDVPANVLTLTLVAGPPGATVQPGTGLFTWTPDQTQGGTTNVITVRVTDDGVPSLSDTKSFSVVVREVNRPPVLAGVSDQAINEGDTLVITNTAADADVPANTLRFSLDPGSPADASIAPVTGVFTWAPTEAQGPSTNVITVRVSDDGTPSLSDTKNFKVIVNELNVAPVLAGISDRTINEGETLVVTHTASDTDLPLNTLTFDLGPGAPTGASIDPLTGVFRWTPSEAQGPSTNVITVRVTDDGTPALSATRTFTVVVNEVNRPPVLAPIPSQTIDEGELLAVTLVATDSDIPGNKLAFNLVAAPAGASIDANSGVFTWTPTEAQGPSTNIIAVRVTDDGSPGLSDTTSFTVVVREQDTAPVLAAIADRVIDEGSTLVITNSASDADLPANHLAFSLVSAPSGAAIDPTTGVLTWTPGETQGPGSYLVTVRVTDDGATSLSDTKSFTVIVNEVNTPPALAVIPDQILDEETTLILTNVATDADVPANSLMFGLDPGGPAGMSLHPSTGVLTWTPSEAQGPSTNVVTVRVADDGTPPLSAARSFTVIVREVNRAPVLAAMANQTIREGDLLTLQSSATDGDVPANSLSFSLDAAPAGSSLDAVTGFFTWRPTTLQAPSTNEVTVRVTDDGRPALSDVKRFVVTVSSLNAAPVIVRITRGDNVASITFMTVLGVHYTLQFTDSLGDQRWIPVATVTGTGAPITIDDPAATASSRFYRVLAE